LLAFSAAAQENELKERLAVEKGMVEMKMIGALKGSSVKGAPYSAEEITESNQMLADGTRIHREVKTTVYRDSEGRVRRETPENISISDPVANVTYILNPKSMTGQKLAMATGNFAFMRTVPDVAASAGPGVSTFTMTTSGDGPANIIVNGQKLDEKAVQEALAKAKANPNGMPGVVTYERTITHTNVEEVAIAGAAAGGMMIAAPTAVTVRRRTPGEPLGKQNIEGVMAEGTRNVSTIEAGAIGNDRPIQVSMENWFSQELQMTVMTKRSDPRTGDESFRVTNIRRGEPGAFLFQPPAGYQITEHTNR